MAQAQYITVAEWQEGTDDNVLLQFASDTGTPIASIGAATDPVLLNCIERGSADVEKHAQRGQRYTGADLAALQTDDDWSLKGLVADLATMHLYRIRGAVIPEAVQSRIDIAQAELNELASGAIVFNDAGAQAAGAPKVSVISLNTRQNLGLASDSVFFPPRLGQTY